MSTPNKLFEPISIAVPIVDSQGKPTPQFQRLIQRLSVGAMLQVAPDGTISIASGGITNDLLGPDAVTSSKILNGTIATVDIADAAITNAKLANMAAHLIKARKTNSTGVPEDATLSEVLDFISSTQGVIFYRGASGWAALAPGTSGQFLKTQGAAADPIWATVASGSGALTMLATQTLAATATNITFSAISGAYKDLIVVGQTRSDKVATADAIRCQLNGDTGANYDYERENRFGQVSAFATTFTEAFSTAASTSIANAANTFCLEIDNYTGTVFHKSIRCHNDIQTSAAANGIFREISSARWKSTAAVTSIKLFSPANNFIIGTTMTLYGRG
jgi:hypothetical protein